MARHSTRARDPILGDTFADEAVRKLDFDFTTLRMPRGASVSLPVRAKHLDDWTRSFLATHPQLDRAPSRLRPR